MAVFCDGQPCLQPVPPGGVFTTLRGHHGRAVDVTAHATRLAAHAAHVGLRAPRVAHIERALELVAAAATSPHGARLRAVIADAPHDRQVWCEATPVDADVNDQVAAPWRLHPTAWSLSPQAHLKLVERREMSAALVSAQARGADDALLIGPDGEWLETTRAAIAGVRRRTLLVSSSPCVLPSVGLARLVQLARAAGIGVASRRLDAATLAECSEFLVVNSLRGVRAVGWCGETSWGGAGLVTAELKARYAAFVAQFNFATVPEPL